MPSEGAKWHRLPFAPESAGEARRMLDSWLTDRTEKPELRDDARLVLSELIGNSVRHAAPLPDGCVEVSWELADEGVDIAVRDGGGAAVPEVQQHDLFALGGRGLAIVEALCQRWWVDANGGRTTTHALLA